MEVPEVGSRWYVWGEHVEIVEHLTVDGLPAVREKRLSGKSKGKKLLPVLAENFVRRASPSVFYGKEAT